MALDRKTQHITRGGQITFQNINMFSQVALKISSWSMMLTLMLAGGMLYFLWSKYDIYVLIKYLQALIVITINPKAGQQEASLLVGHKYYELTWSEIYHNASVHNVIATMMHQLIWSLVLGGIIGIAVFILANYYFKEKGKSLSEDSHLRGTRLVSNQAYAKEFFRKAYASFVYVYSLKRPDRRGQVGKGDIKRLSQCKKLPLPYNFEVQHVLIHGVTGTGKSQLMMMLLEQIIQSSVKAISSHNSSQHERLLSKKRKASNGCTKVILLDEGCNLIPKMYNPETDIILNPFDQRCANWDLWTEFVEGFEFENFASFLIPKSGGSTDPFWVNAARLVLASAALNMRIDPEKSIQKLLRVLTMIELSELNEYLQGSEAQQLTSTEIAKTSLSIRSVLISNLASLKNLIGLDQGDRPKFSIKDWMMDETKSGKLFIAVPEERRETSKSLISLWFSIAIEAMLGLSESDERRVYFICDELAAFQRLEPLERGLTLGRKRGCSFIIGTQSKSQLDDIYGDKVALTLWDQFRTRFYFGSNAARIAEEVSKDIGEEEVEIATANRSYSGEHRRDGVSMISQVVRRPIVSAAEIQQLDNLVCYFRTFKELPVTKVYLPYIDRPNDEDAIIERIITKDFLIEEAISQVTLDKLKVNAVSEDEEADSANTHEEKELKLLNPKDKQKTQKEKSKALPSKTKKGIYEGEMLLNEESYESNEIESTQDKDLDSLNII